MIHGNRTHHTSCMTVIYYLLKWNSFNKISGFSPEKNKVNDYETNKIVWPDHSKVASAVPVQSNYFPSNYFLQNLCSSAGFLCSQFVSNSSINFSFVVAMCISLTLNTIYNSASLCYQSRRNHVLCMCIAEN